MAAVHEVVALAEARGRDAAYPATKIQAEARTVLPPYEDAVTLAVNAAKRVLAPGDVPEIALLVVATESAVDQGKPISTWVHRLCGLPSSCRNFEVKHACYGGTAALHTASAWLATHGRPGAKALVIATDHSRAHVGAEIEFICGATAVALVPTSPITNRGDRSAVGAPWSGAGLGWRKVKPSTGRIIWTWPRKNSMSATSGSGKGLASGLVPLARLTRSAARAISMRRLSR